ncbi:MAG: AAA family ATPase [Cyclobacteriaceae bacterium]|nr:AAA family ATPase [Cyclobacteriaceae bacterium]
MKISKLEIKNFKRFDDLTMDLGKSPGRIIALVGPNGCGKSSVLDAFLVYQSQMYRTVGSGGSGNINDFKKNPILPFNRSANIKIYIDGGLDFSQSGEFTKREQSSQGNTIFSFRSPYRYSTNLLKTMLEQVPEIKDNTDGAGFTNQPDDKITQNYSRIYVHYQELQEKEDLPPSEAKIRILGELNKSIKTV